MKEMGLSRPKWTSPGWPRLAFGGCHHRRHAAYGTPARVTTTAGGRLRDRHMPGGRRPLGPANGGVIENRGIGFLEDKRGSVSAAVVMWDVIFSKSAALIKPSCHLVVNSRTKVNDSDGHESTANNV